MGQLPYFRIRYVHVAPRGFLPLEDSSSQSMSCKEFATALGFNVQFYFAQFLPNDHVSSFLGFWRRGAKENNLLEKRPLYAIIKGVVTLTCRRYGYVKSWPCKERSSLPVWTHFSCLTDFCPISVGVCQSATG